MLENTVFWPCLQWIKYWGIQIYNHTRKSEYRGQWHLRKPLRRLPVTLKTFQMLPIAALHFLQPQGKNILTLTKEKSSGNLCICPKVEDRFPRLNVDEILIPLYNWDLRLCSPCILATGIKKKKKKKEKGGKKILGVYL